MRSFALEKYIIYEDGRVQNSKTGRYIKPQICPKGYLMIVLSFGGFSKTHKIHRLLHSGFIGEIPRKLEVNHIDGNKLNNCLDNLELVTHQENVNHAVKIGLIKSGVDSPLSKGRVKQICPVNLTTVSEFGSARIASIETGISYASISQCVNRKRRSAGGYLWERAKNG